MKKPIPTTPVAVRMPDTLVADLKAIANRQARSLANLVKMVLSEYVAKEGRRGRK